MYITRYMIQFVVYSNQREEEEVGGMVSSFVTILQTCLQLVESRGIKAPFSFPLVGSL